MKNKIRVVNKFILESMVIFLPLCISYLLMGLWLSDVTDFGREFMYPLYLTDIREAYGSVITHGWIEFDTFGQGFKVYSFEISKVFWIGFILSLLLIILGRLLVLGVIKIIEKRIKIKSVGE